MKIPLTKYGWPQVVVFPSAILILMIIALCAKEWLSTGIVLVLEIILSIVLIWTLSFFRDPARVCPSDENLLLSPADGLITEIENVKKNDYFGGPAIKIGIFLSIFNVHINRSPCNVKVSKIIYRHGKYKNALNPESGRVNESNEVQLVRIANPSDKLIVKQISGAIARRIVCKTGPGKELAAGEKFGMIKFGSRTELYVPAHDKLNCLVKKGDKVRAGLTALIRYEKCRELETKKEEACSGVNGNKG
jgi:phosphatidylserine decarboxylase